MANRCVRSWYMIVAMRSGAGLAVRKRRKTLLRRQSTADARGGDTRTRAATDTGIGAAFGVTNVRRNLTVAATDAKNGVKQVSTLTLFRQTCVRSHEVLASFFSREYRWKNHLHRGVVLLTCKYDPPLLPCCPIPVIIHNAPTSPYNDMITEQSLLNSHLKCFVLTRTGFVPVPSLLSMRSPRSLHDIHRDIWKLLHLHHPLLHLLLPLCREDEQRRRDYYLGVDGFWVVLARQDHHLSSRHG